MWNFLSRDNQRRNAPIPINNATTPSLNHTPPTITTTPSTSGERPTAGKKDFCHKRLAKEFADLSTGSVNSIRLLSSSPTEAPTVVPTSDQRGSSSSSFFNPGMLLGSLEPAPNFVVEWKVEITGAPTTLYESETFTLRFRFDERYPMSSPEVVFLGTPPIHPHIYSNGHICLSILYDGWSPALSVMAICLSLVSMLSSCEKKEKPPDDRQYVSMCGPKVSPKSMHWHFDDDTV